MKDMKTKTILVAVLLVISAACIFFYNKSARDFKNEYESMNNVKDSNGTKYRTVSISSNNKFQKVSAKDIVKKIENKETFYVYFGDKLCPWCRSVIEKAVEVSNKNNIKKVYYVDIWNDEGNEILRDRFSVIDGKLKKTVKGKDEYYKLLDYLKDVLNDYNMTDESGNKVDTKEKRIYAPNFIYVEKGKAKKLIEGISTKQVDAREKLTDDMLKDEEKIFNEFFK